MNEEKMKWLTLQDDWEFVFIIAQFIFEQNKNFASANISRTLDCRYNELDSHEIFYYNQRAKHLLRIIAKEYVEPEGESYDVK